MPRLGIKRREKILKTTENNFNKHIGHRMFRGSDGKLLGTFEKFINTGRETLLESMMLKFKEEHFPTEWASSYIKCECEIKDERPVQD